MYQAKLGMNINRYDMALPQKVERERERVILLYFYSVIFCMFLGSKIL